jgi:hypothetical protein
VAIVNRGVTRGDPLADVKIDAALGEVLPTLAGAARCAGRLLDRQSQQPASSRE